MVQRRTADERGRGDAEGIPAAAWWGRRAAAESSGVLQRVDLSCLYRAPCTVRALLPGRGPSTEARHTTQGTGATGPAGTGKPVGWSPAGGPAAGASRDLDELAVKPVSRNRTRGVARRGTDQFQLTTRGSQLTPGRWRRGDATSPAQPKRGEGSGGVAFTSLVLCQSFSTPALSKA